MSWAMVLECHGAIKLEQLTLGLIEIVICVDPGRAPEGG